MDRIPKIQPISNNLPRNAFDVSQRQLFHMPLGMLMPCFVRDLNPGDHLKIRLGGFTRVRPLNTAAFARATQHVQAFFVPYKLLWSYWDEFITGLRQSDTHHSVRFPDQSSALTVPMLNIRQYLSTISNRTDMFGFNRLAGTCRILDMLGYGNAIELFIQSGLKIESPFNVNPFRIAAYQLIYQDWFRNDDFEYRNRSWFNLDGLSGNAPTSVSNDVVEMLTARYCLWKKDVTNNVVPTLLYDQIPASIKRFQGDPALLSKDAALGSSYNSLSGIVKGDPTLIANVDFLTKRANNVYAYADEHVGNGHALLSLASLRNAYALEKLLETTRRAGKNYDDQIAAHFGYVTKHGGRSSQSLYLGGTNAPLAISEVISTSSSDVASFGSVGEQVDNGNGSYLGQIGGKGVIAMNGDVEFTANEHGVFMCLMYISPEAVYESNFLDPFNRKFNREDYFMPEADQLGMQTMQVSDLMLSRHFRDPDEEAQDGDFLTPTELNQLLGWQPRYSEYKTNRDIAHGQYRRYTNLGSYISPKAMYEDISGDAGSRYLSSRYFHVSPSSLDGIFAMDYDGMFETDQFDVNLDINAMLVSNMSVSGMPRI